MSGRLNVLVTGYGNVGTPVLEALTGPEYRERVATFLLVRPASLKDASKKAVIDRLTARGVRLIEGDLEAPVAELTSLLQAAAIATVISVVSFDSLVKQLELVQAAKAAGVRHFIPSEFGLETQALQPTGTLAQLIGVKQSVTAAVKAAGLDYTLIVVGAISEFVVNTDFFGVDVANNSVRAPASFDTTISVSALTDIAFVTAAAVLDSQARNASLYVGEPLTYGQIADIIDSVRGTKLKRSIRTVEDAEKEIAADPQAYS